jgi:hypothetical protein
MAQQTLLGGDGTTGESGATHNTKANSNFTELYAATAAAQSTANTVTTGLSDHLSDGVAAHAASAIAVTSFGTIGATDVQSALEEIAAEAGAVTIPDASEAVEGVAEIATQAETNTGTDDLRIVTPLKLRNRDAAVTALSDGGTVDITTDKWTLATSASSRTFTISHTGQEQNGIITLSGVTITLTFPAAALCLGESGATGSNVVSVTSAVSGDKILVATFKIGSDIIAIVRNLGQ